MPARIDIVIRADAGPMIGTGHFGRAGAVANALLAYQDVALTLVTAKEAVPFAAQFFGDNVAVVPLARSATGPDDALAALGFVPDAVYLDHYGQVPAWEAAALSAGVPIAVIDDLDVARGADLIIRPVPTDQAASSNVFAGPAYLPLGRHVVEARRINRTAPQTATHVHVCFGGSDPTGETRKALVALAALPQFQATVVIGPGALVTHKDLADYVDLPHISFSFAPTQTEIAAQLAQADIALGAGGVMQWERLCIGVPSCVVSVVDNQVPQTTLMANRDAIVWLGDHSTVTPDDIGRALVRLADDPERRKALSDAGQQLIDGQGAMRVAQMVHRLAQRA